MILPTPKQHNNPLMLRYLVAFFVQLNVWILIIRELIYVLFRMKKTTIMNQFLYLEYLLKSQWITKSSERLFGTMRTRKIPLLKLNFKK